MEACSPGLQPVSTPDGGASSHPELFLNLAVVKGQHQFLDLLAERLEAEGLERVGERAWSRPGWEEAV